MASGASDNKQSVMTQVWLALAASAMLVAIAQDNLRHLNTAIIDSAKSAVSLVIMLAGITAVWLGLVKIIERAGFMQRLARWIAPVMRRLFPSIPEGHPANSAMTLSFAANLLGLGNAATPFGLKAMTYLDRLNPVRGTASDSMCLFLAITTSGLAILPTGVISIRMIAGSQNPAAILIPTMLSTATATLVAVISCLFLRRFFRIDTTEVQSVDPEEPAEEGPQTPDLVDEQPPVRWKLYVTWAFFAVCLGAAAWQSVGWSPGQRIGSCLRAEGLSTAQIDSALACAGPTAETVPIKCLSDVENVSKGQAGCLNDSVMNMLSTTWMIPLLLMWFVLYGWARNVDVYATMVEGMKEGLMIIFYVLPFLLSIFLAMGIFRASGAMDLVKELYASGFHAIGLSADILPAEVLPVALTRPLSGSGASALMIDLVNKSPDSIEAFMASVMAGSTDTTFYILAVYFGSVGVVKVRYAILAGLLADGAGLVAAVTFSHMFY